jgi:ferredoxin
LGFACPVYGGYPTENMLSFIKHSADFTHEVPAFTVLCPCSSLGYWGSKELFVQILKAKNIRVISELGFLGNPSHPTVVGSLEQSSQFVKSFFDGLGRPDSHDERDIREFSQKLIRTYEDYSAGRSIEKLKHSSLKAWASKKINMKEKKFQIEHPIMLAKEKCTQCGFCQKACPTKAITLIPYPERDLNKCFACQKCTNLCPQNAFYLKDIERTGYYKGAFHKIKNINDKNKQNNDNSNAKHPKKPLLLKFFSTGFGMAVLILMGKFTDRKLIKKGATKGKAAQV